MATTTTGTSSPSSNNLPTTTIAPLELEQKFSELKMKTPPLSPTIICEDVVFDENNDVDDDETITTTPTKTDNLKNDLDLLAPACKNLISALSVPPVYYEDKTIEKRRPPFHHHHDSQMMKINI